MIDERPSSREKQPDEIRFDEQFDPTQRQVRKDEDLVAGFFHERFGLTCVRFTKEQKRDGKTPDFKVVSEEDLIAYIEVKSSFNTMMMGLGQDGLYRGGGDDPAPNRIAADVEKACDQLLAVNPDASIPNILAFVNHDRLTDSHDLGQVITGYLPTDHGPIPGSLKISEGRLKNKKANIHLFLWCDYHAGVDAEVVVEDPSGVGATGVLMAEPKQRFGFAWNGFSDKSVRKKLGDLLGIDPDNTRPYP